MKFTVKLIRESYIDIEADNYDDAVAVVDNGISIEDIEKGAGVWDVISIKKRE